MNPTLNTVIKLKLANLQLGLGEDIIDFLGNVIQDEFDDQVLIYHTQRDAKVDDKFCRPLEGEEFTVGDPFRPTIPDDLHPNCRCYWEDKETNEILGQDGFFANVEFGSASEEKSTVDGKEGVWRTVRGTKVFFPDGEDPKDVIAKRFKTPKLQTDEPDRFNDLKDQHEHDLKFNMVRDEIKDRINPDKERIKILTEKFEQENLYDKGRWFDGNEVLERNSAMGRIEHLTGDEDAVKFSNAVENKHYEVSDKMFMDVIESDPKLKARFKESHEEVVAFNQALVNKAKTTDKITRFVTKDELKSYQDGIFDQPSASRKGHISFTVENHSLYFGNREVRVEVPAEPLRDKMFPVQYTDFPRHYDDANNFVRNFKYASEAEVKIPSGTKIPDGMEIHWQKRVTLDEKKDIENTFGNLGKIIFEGGVAIDA